MSSTDDITDATPLLSQPEPNRSLRIQPVREAARLLRRASSRRLMREPSMLVRETAAEQLEERQSDWAYSKPVVILDLIWNFAFVAACAAVLVVSREEETSVPLRLWIVGYGAQCVLHMSCVCAEYRRRVRIRRTRRAGIADTGSGDGNSSLGSRGDSGGLSLLDEDNNNSVPKHLESANTMFSFIWWIIGFYWVSAGSQTLAVVAPWLYWTCITCLGFDVFFVVFCVALACVVGIAVCCCLPCIIAILYAVADQEGASKEDIEQLPRFKFRKVGNNEKADASAPSGGIMTECGTDSPREHFLSQEDAECCICLSAYDDGVELRELPCHHHFHCACVDKWLCINATCPLCKYNISKSSNQDREEA